MCVYWQAQVRRMRTLSMFCALCRLQIQKTSIVSPFNADLQARGVARAELVVFFSEPVFRKYSFEHIQM